MMTCHPAYMQEDVPAHEMRQISVRLTPDEIQALKRVARADERSLAWLIRHAVRGFLESHPALPDQE